MNKHSFQLGVNLILLYDLKQEKKRTMHHIEQKNSIANDPCFFRAVLPNLQATAEYKLGFAFRKMTETCPTISFLTFLLSSTSQNISQSIKKIWEKKIISTIFKGHSQNRRFCTINQQF
ncbi:unnamed protein product [Paramecium primaurelia]|uniref:Uncharacterized protein n=1 Tax=Paramecium primaurelia TaxID=5886 RepID=A0A8S1QTR7_PARPR|nr:unnamed protein product [Paramecium primaurelia]